MADQRARNLHRQSGDRRQRSSSCVAEHADRWVTRAAVILLALGLWSSVEGLTVVAHADLGTGIHYLAGSLHTRGWIAICVGIVAIFVGMRARRDDRRWRWAAVTTLVMSAIAQLGSLAERAVRTRSSYSSGGESLPGGVMVKNCFDVVHCSVEVREVGHWIGSGGEGGSQYSVVGLGEHDRGS